MTAKIQRSQARLVRGIRGTWRRKLSIIIGAGACSSTVIHGVGQEALEPVVTNSVPEPSTVFTTTEVLAPQVTPASSVGSAENTTATPLAGTSQLATPPSAPLASTQAGPLRWGILSLHPQLSYQVSYGNGVQSSPGQQQKTVVNQVSPGLLIQVGNHWSLDYAPSLRFYSSKQFKDSTDHAVSLTGRTSYQDWSFGMSQGYAQSSQPLIETAAQTDEETFSTSLTASRQLGGEMSLDLGVYQNFRFVGNQNNANQTSVFGQISDTREWSTMDWLNYHFYPGLTAGIGAGFTYDDVSIGPDSTSEQFKGRISWQVGRKLNLDLNGGLDYRQFRNSTASDLLSPLVSLSLRYQLFEATSLFVSANQSVSSSYFQAEATEGTSINGGVHQRLLKKLFLDISGGYAKTSYHTTAGSNTTNLSDYDTLSFNASLGTTFLKRATASIFYQAAYNSSSSAFYNFSTTQTGLSLAYRF